MRRITDQTGEPDMARYIYFTFFAGKTQLWNQPKHAVLTLQLIKHQNTIFIVVILRRICPPPPSPQFEHH